MVLTHKTLEGFEMAGKQETDIFGRFETAKPNGNMAEVSKWPTVLIGHFKTAMAVSKRPKVSKTTSNSLHYFCAAYKNMIYMFISAKEDFVTVCLSLCLFAHFKDDTGTTDSILMKVLQIMGLALVDLSLNCDSA